jgi:3-deoxy-manno-octulosonate cytidylyltransferase (CMP-KDO synthetase)
MKILGIIPARWSSTRLPGKPLALISDIPMIEWVYAAACDAGLSGENCVVVATDDLKIYNHCQNYGIKVVMTSSEHVSGTDRLIEVVNRPEFKDYDVYINIQGDEPLLQGQHIKNLIESMGPWSKVHGENIVGTILTQIDKDDAKSSSSVKAFIKQNNSQIIMFTRSPLYDYGNNDIANFKKHVGIYAFTKKSLLNISVLTDKTQNELDYNLEQLRWMDNGIKLIGLYIADKLISVDTKSDLKKVNNYVKKQINKTERVSTDS